MYSALKQSVPQNPNNWLPVRTFKKPKANKLATGPQSVNALHRINLVCPKCISSFINSVIIIIIIILGSVPLI
jgi:hypothetical protein